MRAPALFFFAIFSLNVFALDTVEFVDLSRYAGNWYELASNPQFFTPRNCMCTRQQLTPREDGLIAVYNSCRDGSPGGELNDIEGVAKVLDTTSNAKLEVDFGLPFKGSYWIIDLAEDYSWAVVSDKRENSLFILSKTPEVSEDTYSLIVERTAEKTNISKLKRTSQEGCSYP